MLSNPHFELPGIIVASEIDEERYALKAASGDFKSARGNRKGKSRAKKLLKAARR